MIKFSKGLKANYLKIQEKDPKQLYFCTDTREIFKGEDSFTESVRYLEGTTFPEEPAQGILYINTNGVGKVHNGTEWDTLAFPFTEEIAGVKTEADKEVVPTVYAVKSALDDIKSGIEGAITNPTYDSTTRTITLPFANGNDPLVIPLGKDVFIDSTAQNGYNAETHTIDLYLNDGTETTEATKISIPASSLIDVYTGSNSGSVSVSVSDSNEISAQIKLSEKADNALQILADSTEEVDGEEVTIHGGLYLNTSSLDNALTGIRSLIGTIPEGAQSTNVVGYVDEKVSQHEAYVGTIPTKEVDDPDGEEGDKITVPVANSVVGYVDTKVAEASAKAEADMEWIEF